jgi:hypothetical protein
MRPGLRAARLLWLAFLVVLPACAIAQTAVPWPEADRLFRSDPNWLGADGAFSIDLGAGRVLWLFGDSYVAAGPGVSTRDRAQFIRNTAAIESGYDPATASIRFYEGWADGHMAAFAQSPEPDTWLWPMQGIRLGEKLLLFYSRVAVNPTPGTLGFQQVGWNAFLISNPDSDPSNWEWQSLDVPEMTGDIVMGTALIREGGYVYAFGRDDKLHDAYLMRWSVAAASAGTLMDAQWWCGAQGWQPDDECRQIVIPHAGPDFSVQLRPGGEYMEVNTAGFGATNIVWRHASNLEGPWSPPRVLYRPQESDLPFAFVYAAKSHPELKGGDLVVTYVPNLFGGRGKSDLNMYVPKFVRVAGMRNMAEPRN